MLKLYFIKPNIDILKRSTQLELCLHLHPHCFSYLILNTENNQIIDFEKYSFTNPTNEILLSELKMWFTQNQEILHLSFKVSKVAIFAEIFTVLPEKSEKPAEVFEMLGYNIKPDTSIFKDKIEDNFFVYYQLDDELIRFLDNQVVNAEFYCGDSGLLRFYNNRIAYKSYLAAYVYGEDLVICHKKDNHNYYYNRFKIKAKEDLLYYLQLAYEQLGLDKNEYPTYLYGFIEEKSPMYSTSYSYIRNFEIDLTLKNTLPFLYAVEDFPLHYFVNLWGLVL